MILHSELFAILRGFSSLSPPSKLVFPRLSPPEEIHDFFLNEILLNHHLERYPPSDQYQKRFWKWAIEHLESLSHDEACNEDFEVDPRIYDHYLGLLPSPAPSLAFSNTNCRSQICGPPPQSYITHYWNPPPTKPDDTSSYLTATLLESRTTIESGTTGLRTWLASFVLSQYLILHPELISSKRILDLGSGVGFLGIIIASLQRLSEPPATAAVWLTDVNDVVLARCRDNVNLPCNLSSSHPNVNYRILDWSASLEEDRLPALESLLRDEIDPELVVGADIVFDPSLVPALIGTIKLALQPRSWEVPDSSSLALIALTVRNGETLAMFLDYARGAGLLVVDLAFELDKAAFLETIEGDNSDVRIFQIKLV